MSFVNLQKRRNQQVVRCGFLFLVFFMNKRSVTMMRVLVSVGVLLSALLLSSGALFAQQPDTSNEAAVSVRGQGSGTATLTQWPPSLSELLNEMGRKAPYLLPKVDSLALDYRYAAGDSTSQWSFVLGWQPGSRVLHNGEILSRSRAPSGLQMVSVELRAQVHSGGERVGDMIIAVDSMALSPFPGIYSFEVTVGHDRVFLNSPAAEARQALVRGVTLDSLVVERMGFVSTGRSTSDRRRAPDARERRQEPRRAPSVYEPRTSIYVGWRVAPRPYYVGERNGKRTVEPRGETMGRGTTTGDSRTATRGTRRGSDAESETQKRRSKSKDKDEDEEEEDETSLRLPALAAVAAVGVVAYTGGTVGVYGRGDTPIGLAAGYTRPGGGIQLQAAVNEAVLNGTAGQKLTVKTLGFYDVFSFPLQPAAGLGFQIDPRREANVRPSFSVGLAANVGRVVLFGGVDVVQETPEIGLAYNFRHWRRSRAQPGEGEGQ